MPSPISRDPVYDQDGAPSCAVDNHRCLERHDLDAAARQMSEHLGHNHARQRPRATSDRTESVRSD